MGEILVLAFNIITRAIQIYSVLLIIYILMSWVPASRETKFGELLAKITEPYLGFFRKFIPPIGMIDFSPIIALFALTFITDGIRMVFKMLLSSLG